MPLYQWKSKTFSSYAYGDIIVFADTIATARAKVKKHIKEEYRNNPEYAKQLLQGVTGDMFEPPVIISSDVVIIYGSD